MNAKELFRESIKEEIESLKEIEALADEREEEDVKTLVKRIIRHELKESKREITSILKDKSGKDAK